MKVMTTAIPGLLLLEPRRFGDERGFFMESFNEARFAELTGSHLRFVQDNHSRSQQSVVRGLHYQLRQPQGKLVRVVAGEVLDVAVDLRRSSPTFGHWQSFRLSADNALQLWLPPGFAHGFSVLSPTADFLYKTTDYYAPGDEHSILWDDPDLGIDWQLPSAPVVSAKDAAARRFRDAEYFP